MKSIISQPDGVKQLNRYRVYNILLRERVVSRPQLAHQTGLSRAGIAVLTDELIVQGLVIEAGLGSSRGGRRPVLLKFNPDAAYALGACMHDSQWVVVVTNLDAQVIAHDIVSFTKTDPEASVAALSKGVKSILTQVDTKKILPAMGLGTPGLVDIRTGIIKGAFDIGWIDVPLAHMVQEATGFPVIIANRSKVGALAEMHSTSERGIKNLVCITIGTGVSAGIIYHGELYVGTNSSAGELGHVTVLPDGPLCGCGNRGCLQELVSEKAITNAARRRLKKGAGGILAEKAGLHPERITFSDVIHAAEAADSVSVEVMNEIASYLAIGIANIVNLLNPELIVLGGPVAQDCTMLIEAVKREVRLRAMAYPLSVVDIVPSSLRLDAGAVGASVLVLQQAATLIFGGGYAKYTREAL